MASAARDLLITRMKKLFESADYSDFTITCGPETFKVHKAIVCSRSEFFKRAERFAVGQEAGNTTVDLPEDDPEVVRFLIQYMYEGDYGPEMPSPVVDVPKQQAFHYEFPHTCSPGCPKEYLVCPHHECRPNTCKEACKDFVCSQCCEEYSTCGDADALLLHAKMYEMADKYAVEGLKEVSRAKFSDTSKFHWDTEHFAPAAHYAFSTTPENDMGLRDVVSRIIADHIDILNKPAVEALLHEHNGLAVGLLKAKAEAIGWTRSAEVVDT